MPLVDPTPHRVSACPVHFLWDGRGRGRAFVRAGFLGLVAGGMIATGASTLHAPALHTVAFVVLAGAVAVYGVGQVLSYALRR